MFASGMEARRAETAFGSGSRQPASAWRGERPDDNLTPLTAMRDSARNVSSENDLRANYSYMRFRRS